MTRHRSAQVEKTSVAAAGNTNVRSRDDFRKFLKAKRVQAKSIQEVDQIKAVENVIIKTGENEESADAEMVAEI